MVAVRLLRRAALAGVVSLLSLMVDVPAVWAWSPTMGAIVEHAPAVPLSDSEMMEIRGGQTIQWEYACGIAGVVQGSLQISTPYIGLACAAMSLTNALEDEIYAPLQQSIYTVFMDMGYDQANMGDYRHYTEVDLDVACDDFSGYTCGGSSQQAATYSITVEGDLNEWYCGAANCMCDYDSDCWSWDCPDGWCYGP